MPYTKVFSGPGPLPIVVSMPVTAPEQLLIVAGSAFANNPGGPISIEILVDATSVGVCKFFANEAGVHLALVPAFIPLALSPASSPFAVTLRPDPAIPGQTLTDDYDLFEVLLIE